MSFELDRIVAKYGQRGLLVDTNLLVLHLVGTFDVTRLGTFKITKAFDESDFELLSLIIGCFKGIVATPHVLAEVNSLLNLLPEAEREACLQGFSEAIQILEERYEESRTLARTDGFDWLGLTDCSVLHGARGEFPVITTDMLLYETLLRRGVDAINFNHLRL